MTDTDISSLYYYIIIIVVNRLGAATSALCATGVGSDAGNVDFQYAVDFLNSAQLLQDTTVIN